MHGGMGEAGRPARRRSSLQGNGHSRFSALLTTISECRCGKGLIVKLSASFMSTSGWPLRRPFFFAEQ